MKTSDAQIARTKAREGYHRKLPDGSCAAYSEVINGKADRATIGWGCTRGVKMGDVWTLEQAEAGLRAELAIHEERVTRLITVPLNQNQFDALVDADFNCAILDSGGGPSTLRKKLNAGDYAGAANEFDRWTKFAGKPVSGLVARRSENKAVFLSPVGEPAPQDMPQAAKPAMTTGQKAAAWSAPPAFLATALAIFQAWKDTADGVAAAGMWVIGQPIAAGIVAVTAGVLWLTTKVKPS